VDVLRDPYALLLRASLLLALIGGFGLGLTLMLSFVLRVPVGADVGALIQGHGQVQALGFMVLTIVAVGSRLLPRFHRTHLERGALVSTGGIAVAVGVALRALGQPLPLSTPRSIAMVLSGLLPFFGIILAVYAFGVAVRQGRSPGDREPIILPLTMATSLIASQVLLVVASFGLAGGAVTVPSGLDEAIIHLELWGFAATMILAIARHTWPNMLLLRAARSNLIRPALLLWAVGSLGTPLTWLLASDAIVIRALGALAQLAGAALYALALRLFDPPARASTLPHITEPPRLWLRVAFAFLIAAAATNGFAALSGEAGSSTTLLALSAARHALAQGFLLPVIVFMASRILPGFSPLMMGRPLLLAALMWSLFVSAALRAGAEIIGGYAEGWDVLVALGGTIATVVFLVFAALLWHTTGRHTARAPGVSASP